MLHEDWYKIVDEYYKQIENCNVYDSDLIWKWRKNLYSL
jgi:hypothetical protein